MVNIIDWAGCYLPIPGTGGTIATPIGMMLCLEGKKKHRIEPNEDFLP